MTSGSEFPLNMFNSRIKSPAPPSIGRLHDYFIEEEESSDISAALVSHCSFHAYENYFRSVAFSGKGGVQSFVVLTDADIRVERLAARSAVLERALTQTQEALAQTQAALNFIQSWVNESRQEPERTIAPEVLADAALSVRVVASRLLGDGTIVSCEIERANEHDSPAEYALIVTTSTEITDEIEDAFYSSVSEILAPDISRDLQVLLEPADMQDAL
jgi:hypothetical protein